MAIVVVNPNPVFDRTISLPELVPGTVMRTHDVEVTAGGKGINVARVLRSLGDPVHLIVPVGREDHAAYRRLLDAEDAHATTFEVSGTVRVASIYRESAVGRVSVVNDAGFALPIGEWRDFIAFVESKVRAGDLVLIMGSLPTGLPNDAAAWLVDAMNSRGAFTLVDTAPQWLATALEARPNVVAPNVHEAAVTLADASSSVFDDSSLSHDQARTQALEYAHEIASRTGHLACVTAGAAGVAYVLDDRSGWVEAPTIDLVSAVGAGDSFVAGLASKWHAQLADGREPDWDEAVAFGVACAAASCEVVRAGGADPARVGALADLVDVVQPIGQVVSP